MTTIERKPEGQRLERLISDCFSGGEICRRELRLQDGEAQALEQAYPASRVRPMGGSWYEITFQGAFQHGN